MLGIDKLRASPYKPSTNQVERLHRSINAILGKTVASHQKDWDTRLSFAMSAYRASHHESTGYTPNMLTLGTEVRAPADIMYGSRNEPSSETYFARECGCEGIVMSDECMICVSVCLSPVPPDWNW